MLISVAVKCRSAIEENVERCRILSFASTLSWIFPFEPAPWSPLAGRGLPSQGSKSVEPTTLLLPPRNFYPPPTVVNNRRGTTRGSGRHSNRPYVCDSQAFPGLPFATNKQQNIQRFMNTSHAALLGDVYQPIFTMSFEYGWLTAFSFERKSF